MFNELTPLLDPLGFIGVYFFYYAANEVVMTPIKLGLYSSILIYPFMLVGRYLHLRLLKNKLNRIVKLYIVSLAVTILFWILMLIWRTIGTGSPDVSFNIITLAAGWIVCAAAALPFVLVGYHVHRKMTERWKMPTLLSLYIITLLLCILFWCIMTLWLAYGVVAPYPYT